MIITTKSLPLVTMSDLADGDFDGADFDFDVEGFVEAQRESVWFQRHQMAMFRADDDDELIEGGWRADIIHPAEASRRLAPYEACRVSLFCECGKRLDDLGVMRGNSLAGKYRRLIVPLLPRRKMASLRPRLVGRRADGESHWQRWQYECPMTRRCGRRPIIRYDKLTLAFILAGEDGRRDIRLPLRLPTSAT